MGGKHHQKKFKQKINDTSLWLKRIRNSVELKEWWRMLSLKLLGHYRYYGMSGNYRWMQNFYQQVVKLTFKWVNRRSQRKSYNWDQFRRFLLFNLSPEAKDIPFVIQPETVEDVLLKSRMREIFTFGSVRGLIVTSGLLLRKEVRYGLYLTGAQRVVIFLFHPLRVLCGFLKPYFKSIKKSPMFWPLQLKMPETLKCSETKLLRQ